MLGDLIVEITFALAGLAWWGIVTLSSGFCHLRVEEEEEEDCGTLYRYWYALGANLYFTWAQCVVIAVFHCVSCRSGATTDIHRKRWQWLKWLSLVDAVPMVWVIVTVIALKADSEFARETPFMWLALLFYICVLALRLAIFVKIPCAVGIQIVRAGEAVQTTVAARAGLEIAVPGVVVETMETAQPASPPSVTQNPMIATAPAAATEPKKPDAAGNNVLYIV